MKPRSRALTRPLVDLVGRPVAGSAGRVGVVPAVLIGFVLAALLVGGLAVTDLARDDSGVKIPFVGRGATEADDEPDENEVSDENADAEEGADEGQEPGGRDDERAGEERDGGEG